MSSPSSLTPKLDYKRIFLLIDSLLPYPICFYYQILPLAFNEQYIIVGMVNPNDKTALQHLRNVLSNRKNRLKIKSLNSKVVDKILTAYLEYRDENNVKPPAKLQESSANERTTLEVSSEAQKQLKKSSSLPQKAPRDQGLLSRLRTLEVATQYLSEPIEQLKEIPPSQLLPELLGRVVQGGIGRLYFERHSKEGRIIWSQNGILQETLEGLSVSAFHRTLNDLKSLANLPVAPIERLKKVEIARRYEEDSLLIRIHFMTNRYGEEATLQILRGQALQFYQKKQMDRLGEEALHLAQKLDRKLKQIYIRTHYNPATPDVLPDLDQLVHHLQNQIHKIRDL